MARLIYDAKRFLFLTTCLWCKLYVLLKKSVRHFFVFSSLLKALEAIFIFIESEDLLFCKMDIGPIHRLKRAQN